MFAHLTNEVSNDLIELESVIGQCSAQAESRGALDLEAIEVEGENASHEALMLGISHLYFRNLFECERAARERLAFSLGTLKSHEPPNHEHTADIDGIKSALLYPTRRQIEYKLKYQILSENLRASLEARIGQEPFELMGTLERNGVLGH
ncbi:hypothetical protein OOT55_17620 [Marinimicrobium sp. C6131]|uniref:hypothetical protein n=1 Tax=Marinimicrobium sp. C6131 TaxID=3022676 RepID=UPI00223E0E16|nr:hypothetical protein [Marinimicrobium sp. C6131]UZJ44454.1 hypothetical protein OOT55_17620 [Marinimicrobium sp. C6131]